MIILGASVLLGIVGFFWMLVIQIQNKNYIWGLASFLLGFPALIYGLLNFGTAKKPFLLIVLSIVLLFVGLAMLSPDQMAQMKN